MIIPGRIVGDGLVSSVSPNFPIEYYILSHIEFAGGVIGSLTDRPIYEIVIDDAGTRYHFAGLACRDANGRYDVFSLKTGEWIVEPGLVYCAERQS